MTANYTPKRYTCPVPLPDGFISDSEGQSILDFLERITRLSVADLHLDMLTLPEYAHPCYLGAFRKGYRAHYLGEEYSSNPYRHTFYRKCWSDGWCRAQGGGANENG